MNRLRTVRRKVAAAFTRERVAAGGLATFTVSTAAAGWTVNPTAGFATTAAAAAVVTVLAGWEGR